MDVRNKIRVYKTIITPAMFYGAAVWSHAATSHRNKIQVIQNKILRMIVNAPWYVRNTTIMKDQEIPITKDSLRERTSRTYAREKHMETAS